MTATLSAAASTSTSGAVAQSPRRRVLGITSPRQLPTWILAHLALLLVVCAFLAPMLWLIFGSLHADSALTVQLGGRWSLSNFVAVMTPETLWLPLLNSFLLSAGTAVLTVLCSALAAYPLSRYSMRFRRTFLYTIVFSTGLPITAVMVPVYVLFATFAITDSRVATILFMSATSLPFAIWMMKNFMDGVPVSLEEAAWTDGAGWFDSLRGIVLPLMAPGLAVVSIFVFVQQWGDFFIPFVLLQSPEKQPASVSIYTFFSSYGAVAYGQLAAFSILYTLPIIALYGVLSKALGGGFSFAGGLKG
jgi:multiple sugar transport system permease protein